MARSDTAPTTRYSMVQLKAIVAAGMTISDAQQLLDDGYTPEDVLELAQLAASRGKTEAFTKDDLAAVLADNTQSMRKALKPENETHPNRSHYHPGGGPIPSLPYECYYNNFPVHKALETHHDRERELCAMVQPGVYRILRKDFSDMTVTARADTTPNGVVTKLLIEFPVTREEKALIPPMHVVLYQMVHPELPPKQRYLQAVNEHMEATLLGQDA